MTLLLSYIWLNFRPFLSKIQQKVQSTNNLETVIKLEQNMFSKNFPHNHHLFEYIFQSFPTILWRSWQCRLYSVFSGPSPTCSWTPPASWWCLPALFSTCRRGRSLLVLGQENRGVVKQLDVVFVEEVAHTLGGVNWSIFPMHKPFLCRYFWSFCFESLHESLQGL